MTLEQHLELNRLLETYRNAVTRTAICKLDRVDESIDAELDAKAAIEAFVREMVK